MRRRSALIAVVVLPLILTGQVRVVPQGTNALRQAQFLEKRGDVEQAREIYRRILADDPSNVNAYRRLKTSLIRGGELDQAIELVSAQLRIRPESLGDKIELGELFYLSDRRNEARAWWQGLEDQYQTKPQYYRLQVFSLARLSLSQEMDSLAVRARRRFDDPAFLSMDLANYYYSRGAVRRAVNEYINHLLVNRRQKKYVTSRILSLSDEEENHSLIEQILVERLAENESLLGEILADFYFKTGNYRAAIGQHTRLGFNHRNDLTRWLELAANLRAEGQIAFAIQAYEIVLHDDKPIDLPPGVIGEALLGMGRCYENQVTKVDQPRPLLEFYPDNVIFENHFYDHPKLELEPLLTAFQIYDSILVELPGSILLAQVHYRLGEIKYRITRDFDGALLSYRAGLRANPAQATRVQLELRIGDVLLARGDHEAGLAHFLPLMANAAGAANPYLLKVVQANLLAGNAESALTLVETTLAEADPGDRYFNDLMEIQDFLTTYYLDAGSAGQAEFAVFLQSEALIKQNKLNEALVILNTIVRRKAGEEIIEMAALRGALLNLRTANPDGALALAEVLSEGKMTDYGFVITGQILERLVGDQPAAVDSYHRLLENHPNSILAEPVRFHLRELNQSLGS